MLSRVHSAVLLGIEAKLVEVQIDLNQSGLPGTQTVGLPGTIVRESQERVRIAIRNSGFKSTPSRITVNLAPADLPKQGSTVDLAVAAAILAAECERRTRPEWLVAGELALDGTLRPVTGALPMALAARAAGFAGVVVPEGNGQEAASVDGIEVVGLGDLAQAYGFLTGDTDEPRVKAGPLVTDEPVCATPSRSPPPAGTTFSSRVRQVRGRRCLPGACARSFPP